MAGIMERTRGFHSARMDERQGLPVSVFTAAHRRRTDPAQTRRIGNEFCCLSTFSVTRTVLKWPAHECKRGEGPGGEAIFRNTLLPGVCRGSRRPAHLSRLLGHHLPPLRHATRIV